ncbi:MAG TPA: hypothetical protein VKM93_12430 [Terriglobia bacterium]|nr:hypothetical protein [Terriglobia bacterium]
MKELLTCTCGKVGTVRQLACIRHKASVLHQHSRHIRVLLDKACVPFAEIGRRLGVTREQARLMAQYLGYPTGRSRERTCNINLLPQLAAKKPLLAKLEQDCPFPVVFLQRLRKPGLWCRRVSILDHICFVAKASFFKSHYVRVLGSLRTSSTPEPKSLLGTEFVLCSLPVDGWLVIPRAHYRLAVFRRWTKGVTSGWTGPWDVSTALNGWHLIEGAGGSRQSVVDGSGKLMADG